ncbi:hypothetical protein MNBD_ALPHA01-1659 [hydrothermal vent metagenome]|uniref:Uncharacterized protein n=1 Tax=hydrothermal vent metagenome TaxID=652676 RepID=A0A3B0SPC6_9ZZZZ
MARSGRRDKRNVGLPPIILSVISAETIHLNLKDNLLHNVIEIYKRCSDK